MRPRRRSNPVHKRAIVPLDGSPFAEAVLPFFRQIAGPLDIEVMKPGEPAPHQVGNDNGADGRCRSFGGHHMTARTHREEDVMLVRALMTGAPITLPPDISIFEARRLMDGARIRHVLVTLGGDLLGIVTDRDIRLNMPSQATSLSVWELNYLLAKVTVGEVMTRSVIRIGPDLDAHDAAQMMLDHKIGALPVIDDGRLIGIVTETDLLRAFVKVGAESRTLRA